MAPDEEFYEKVNESYQAKVAKLARISQEHNLGVLPGYDLYNQAWIWIYAVRDGGGIPELPAELRTWLVEDANWLGEGMYDKEELEGESDYDLLMAYTSAVHSYATSQM